MQSRTIRAIFARHGESSNDYAHYGECAHYGDYGDYGDYADPRHHSDAIRKLCSRARFRTAVKTGSGGPTSPWEIDLAEVIERADNR